MPSANMFYVFIQSFLSACRLSSWGAAYLFFIFILLKLRMHHSFVKCHILPSLLYSLPPRAAWNSSPNHPLPNWGKEITWNHWGDKSASHIFPKTLSPRIWLWHVGDVPKPNTSESALPKQTLRWDGESIDPVPMAVTGFGWPREVCDGFPMGLGCLTPCRS